jgi:hypothetical protein
MSKLNFKQLKAIAKDRGVQVSFGMKAADLLAVLQAA